MATMNTYSYYLPIPVSIRMENTKALYSFVVGVCVRKSSTRKGENAFYFFAGEPNRCLRLFFTTDH